jgi:hypothetical protein
LSKFKRDSCDNCTRIDEKNCYEKDYTCYTEEELFAGNMIDIALNLREHYARKIVESQELMNDKIIKFFVDEGLVEFKFETKTELFNDMKTIRIDDNG